MESNLGCLIKGHKGNGKIYIPQDWPTVWYTNCGNCDRPLCMTIHTHGKWVESPNPNPDPNPEARPGGRRP